VAVIEMLMRACIAVRSAHGTMLERVSSEQGVSTVQYALLVAIVALVVAVLVGALGSGIKGLFGTAHTCVGGHKPATACRVGPLLRGSAQEAGP
jgi:Flp pilus assembly pilin Flp